MARIAHRRMILVLPETIWQPNFDQLAIQDFARKRKARMLVLVTSIVQA
jgi:hypothetical protein